MAFDLPALPYDKNALTPHISSETLDYHHGKHHAAYVKKLNDLVPGTAYEGKSLEEIIKASANDNQAVFNNAAQVWNHTFYWHCLSPNGGGEPSGPLAEAIMRDFGTLDHFKEEFKAAATSQFGSGWAWLASDSSGKLSIIKTPNAENPLSEGNGTAVLTCDVWEHAYYLDYQNKRPDYVDTFMNELVNWDFAAENYKKAQQ